MTTTTGADPVDTVRLFAEPVRRWGADGYLPHALCRRGIPYRRSGPITVFPTSSNTPPACSTVCADSSFSGAHVSSTRSVPPGARLGQD
ncbi:hypothetical protein [Streptomyces sp. bgisy060]|uniref:hypothetical protein n=1 Tax=Streptomyces sp. bgisy060 TaxID=3413775 RepID=UPI003EBF11CB